MKLPLISLFCGAGGLDQGFRKAGFKTTVAYDSNPAAIRTYNLNARRKIAIQADLRLLSPDDLFSAIERLGPEGHPVGMIGGPPCQGFSAGNVHADSKDPRNVLPFRYAKLLGAVNAKYTIHFFLFENVIGLKRPKHRRRLSLIKNAFGKAGFNVFQGDLDSKDFGVPQTRHRLFLVGLNAKLYPGVDSFPFPAPTCKTASSVADAIRGLPAPAFFRRGISASEIPMHRNHWTMRPRSSKLLGSSQKTSRSFKRLEWNEPSPTVAYGHREIHVHPDGGRRLSVYEAMLLQGFPPTYKLMGNLSEQVTQVCNAVPPPVAEALAQTIKSMIVAKLRTADAIH